MNHTKRTPQRNHGGPHSRRKSQLILKIITDTERAPFLERAKEVYPKIYSQFNLKNIQTLFHFFNWSTV